ncbi:DUF3955 domain-containing protein [Lysobacter sp. Root983]|uniref:DUF3955 domain-containing protein n=1 Tax=Lysobacter sp. Root983 TaxID=1736613 RepID=UPI000AAC29DF|nr:DUF3955 domain-containing protein [Lysobacter sp. Root983]
MSSPSLTSQVAVSLLCLGSLCLIAFRLIGVSIDEDGVLHEPFALIPIGFALIASGAVVGTVGLVRAALGALTRRRR